MAIYSRHTLDIQKSVKKYCKKPPGFALTEASRVCITTSYLPGLCGNYGSC